ncbi:MAG TPA: tetratricopeptide repeat protein [Xanthobacteraceae bacterium]|nr:tetratricopeptide repeat protein [Xanthobacteraceae bacterium]
MIKRIVLGAVLVALASIGSAAAGPLQAGIAAFNRHDYTRAAQILLPLAAAGDPRAQTYMGFLYANGRGVVQNRIVASNWYRSAAEQGDPTAQYMLGLMYDRGHGVPQDYVIAYTWLNLAVAHASPRERQYWLRIRDAVSSKLSLRQLTEAQRRAVEWQAGRPVIYSHWPYE